MTAAHAGLVGILLAAGRGRRYDASGRIDKLLTPAARGPHAGEALAVAAARALRAALPRVVAVVRPGVDVSARELAERLAQAGCEVVINGAADAGMGTSLACGVRAAPDASGWVIALADMPAIEPDTIRAVADALARGACTAAPYVGDERGHPVGFSPALRAPLLALEGDAGARALLLQHPPTRVAVNDSGVFYDVDQP